MDELSVSPLTDPAAPAPTADAPTPPVDRAPVDLSVLEKIEAELAAVERALAQIDEGIYEGFEGIEGIDAPSVTG